MKQSRSEATVGQGARPTKSGRGALVGEAPSPGEGAAIVGTAFMAVQLSDRDTSSAAGRLTAGKPCPYTQAYNTFETVSRA